MDIKWHRIEPTLVQKIGYRTLITKNFTLPSGVTEPYVTKEKEGSHCVATIAITTDGKAVVARQFRPGPEMIMDEIAGGGVEAGEDYLLAAQRELLEETGYQAGELQPLGTIYKDAYTNTTWHYFLATDCTADDNGASPDDKEFIDIQLISIDELIYNGRNARMTDTEALFLAYDKLIELKTKYL